MTVSAPAAESTTTFGYTTIAAGLSDAMSARATPPPATTTAAAIATVQPAHRTCPIFNLLSTVLGRRLMRTGLLLLPNLLAWDGDHVLPSRISSRVHVLRGPGHQCLRAV